jgi:hypothetical protein
MTHLARNASPPQWPLAALGIALALGAITWFLFQSPADEKVADTLRPTATSPSVSTVGMGTPKLTVGDADLGREVASSIGALKTALTGISDTASAHAALPKLREAMEQLDQLGSLSAKLPAEGKSTLAKLIVTATPAINELCEKVLATPGVGAIAKPTIDGLRSKLDTLARA